MSTRSNFAQSVNEIVGECLPGRHHKRSYNTRAYTVMTIFQKTNVTSVMDLTRRDEC